MAGAVKSGQRLGRNLKSHLRALQAWCHAMATRPDADDRVCACIAEQMSTVRKTYVESLRKHQQAKVGLGPAVSPHAIASPVLKPRLSRLRPLSRFEPRHARASRRWTLPRRPD